MSEIKDAAQVTSDLANKLAKTLCDVVVKLPNLTPSAKKGDKAFELAHDLCDALLARAEEILDGWESQGESVDAIYSQARVMSELLEQYRAWILKLWCEDFIGNCSGMWEYDVWCPLKEARATLADLTKALETLCELTKAETTDLHAKENCGQ